MNKPRFNFLTLFPLELKSALSFGVVGQSAAHGLLDFHFINPRDFTNNKHRSVDDTPYGGGDGMLMTPEPLAKALESLGDDAGHVVYLSPQGQLWNNELAKSWASQHPKITLVCGRYAGIDERWIKQNVDEEISIGDYILSGAEAAAMVVVDSIGRFVPGVLGNEKSSREESLQDSLLEAPQFTKPQDYLGVQVPEVLLSGHHKKITEWKRFVSIARTYVKRPDLFRRALENNQVSADELKAARDFVKTMADSERELLGLKEFL